MEKYKNYLASKFGAWQIVIAILVALCMLVWICVDMCTPVYSTELESHFQQLEMVKQNTADMYKLKNATIDIDDSGMTLTLKGKTNALKASFDADYNYINAEVVDNRIGANLIVSIVLIFIAFAYGYLLSYALLLVLYIPIGVYHVVKDMKNKFVSDKNKQKRKNT